ncbi:MAG TPA: cupin domain-containing protein [Bacteroidia bacterium]|jgi:mannose-6-phosphate isomerase-like protein (cupin superfamily)|nr:cupin domain-containing protein [Bacteroidia bacterium]
MSEPKAYNQHMNVLYEHLEVIDVPALVEKCTDQWFNQTLSKVNDSVARLGIVEGEYHWHKHELEDEFFFVLQGRLFIDLEDRTLELGPMQGTTITKGVMHRPRAPYKTVMLMVENSSIDPLGTSPT